MIKVCQITMYDGELTNTKTRELPEFTVKAIKKVLREEWQTDADEEMSDSDFWSCAEFRKRKNTIMCRNIDGGEMDIFVQV